MSGSPPVAGVRWRRLCMAKMIPLPTKALSKKVAATAAAEMLPSNTLSLELRSTFTPGALIVALPDFFVVVVGFCVVVFAVVPFFVVVGLAVVFFVVPFGFGVVFGFGFGLGFGLSPSGPGPKPSSPSNATPPPIATGLLDRIGSNRPPMSSTVCLLGRMPSMNSSTFSSAFSLSELSAAAIIAPLARNAAAVASDAGDEYWLPYETTGSGWLTRICGMRKP